jgi:hypothetical protein
MLEHLTPGPRDEALAGDLLEGFRSGRSEGWYWRQALGACAISWLNNLRARASLLAFAFLWSMLAPAWIAIVERAENRSGSMSLIELLESFAVFVFSNMSFIWAGMLLYLASHAHFARTIRARKIKLLFGLAVPLFLVIYFATFVLMNLYAYPGPVVDLRTITPLGAIADVRLWAMVIRIPYLLTLLFALWRVAPRLSSARWMPGWFESNGSFSRPFIPSFVLGLDPYTVKRFFALMVGAGLINSMIAGFFLCRLPESHSPTLSALLVQAIFYVAIGGVAGVAGAWVYWKSPSSPFREEAPVPFPLFALICASGWVWVPSMMLFFEQISPATAIVAVIGAISLAIGLRNATFLVFSGARQDSSILEPERADLFAESLYRAPREAHGFAIAIFIYAGSWTLLNRWNLTGAALFALSAFLFAWRRTFVPHRQLHGKYEYTRAALRLAFVVIPAVLVTIWALLDGVAYRNRAEAAGIAAGDGAAGGDQARSKSTSAAVGSGISGYESIILWPIPEKKQIIPPLPAENSFLAKGTTKPLIIRFDAPYWYFQPPAKRPGPRAYQAHGTPLAADIQANNFMPLIMEAHQNLGGSIRIDRCREIKVAILNRDNRPGAINLAVLLTDTSSPAKLSVYLGQQPIASSLPGQFAVKSSPATEVLRFLIPAQAKIRRFDEITVMFLPDQENFESGPKVAVQDFELLPR